MQIQAQSTKTFNGFRPQDLIYAKQNFNQALHTLKKIAPDYYKSATLNVNYIMKKAESANYDLFFETNAKGEKIPTLFVKDIKSGHTFSIFNIFDHHGKNYDKLKELFSYIK